MWRINSTKLHDLDICGVCQSEPILLVSYPDTLTSQYRIKCDCETSPTMDTIDECIEWWEA